MSAEPVHVTNYLDAADTRSSLDAVRALGALVDERDDGMIIRGPGLRAATPGAAIDVGNAGTLLRLLPGWLAGQPTAGAGRSTATRASAAARSTASPTPLARDGRAARGARRTASRR